MQVTNMKIHQMGPKYNIHTIQPKQSNGKKSKGHIPDTTGPKAPWAHALGLVKSPPCKGGGVWTQSPLLHKAVSGSHVEAVHAGIPEIFLL